jgi:hypothetical protein
LKTCSTVALSGRTDLELDTSNLSYRSPCEDFCATANSTIKTESNSSSCSKGEHKLTAGKPISGQLLASLYWLNMSLGLTSPDAIARGFSASLAIVQSNPANLPLRKISKRSNAGSTKRPSSSKKADRRRNHLLHRRIAVSAHPSNHTEMGQRRLLSRDFASPERLAKDLCYRRSRTLAR